MSPLSWIPVVVLIISIIAIVWLVFRAVLWAAVLGVLGLFVLAGLGWLWWWVPIVAAIVTLIGFLIGLLHITIGRVVLATVTILSLAAGVGSFGYANWGWLNGPRPGGIDSIAFNPEVDFLPAEAKCDTNLFVDHSVRLVVPGDPAMKQFPTAVSIPFTGADDAAVFSEVTKTEICRNPTELEMVVNEMLLWTSADIPGADENKGWLNEIKADIDSTPFGIDSFVDKTPTGELFVTETYQKYAAWVNTVLLRSVGEGKQSLTSIRNWEISAVADPRGLPSATQAGVQENKPAWVRSFIDKMGNCLLRFGFNAEDRRFEIFECELPPTPDTPGTPGTPPGTGGGCVTDCHTEPPPPDCYDDCLKDWNLNVPAPEGVTPMGPGELKPSPAPVQTQAPTLPENETPSSGSQAPGATVPDPVRETPPPATGENGGSVNPTPAPSETTPPVNGTDPGNPFGG